MTSQFPSIGRKQSDPPSFANFIPYNALHLANNTNGLISEYLKPLGITLHEWHVILFLNHYGKLRIGDLADLTLIGQSTLSRVIDRMQKRKLVERNINPDNRRVVEVSLTAPGREVMSNIAPIVDTVHTLLAEALTEEEHGTLFTLFDKLNNKLAEGKRRLAEES